MESGDSKSSNLQTPDLLRTPDPQKPQRSDQMDLIQTVAVSTRSAENLPRGVITTPNANQPLVN